MSSFYPHSFLSLPSTRARKAFSNDMCQKHGEMIMLPQAGSNKPSAKNSESKSFLEILEQAENHCKDCETVSPMICVERCDV